MSYKPPVSDASTIKKGVVQLSGDLAGTAASPTVPGLASKLDASQKGAVNGVATLDGTGKVPSAQLPSSASPVTSVAGKTGVVTLVKADVGLGSVDNTSDASKPISTATQTALDAKADTSHTHGAAAITSGTFTYSLLPAGTTLTVAKSGGVWPARPTSRTDIIVQWKGPDPSPAIVSSGTGGMMDNVDIRMITP